MVLSICCMIMFNVAVILYDSVCYIRLLCKRHKLWIVKIIALLRCRTHSKSGEKSSTGWLGWCTRTKKGEITLSKEAVITVCAEERVKENQVIDAE